VLERVSEQIVNPKFKLGNGLVFEHFHQPEGDTVGLIYGPEGWPSPIEVVVLRHPFHGFKADWYLPEGLERPASFSSLKQALEHAGKLLDSKRLADFKIKLRPTAKPAKPLPPKVTKEVFRGSKNKVFCRELSYSDGSREFWYVAPDKWLGEVKLYQSAKREPIMTITSMPKSMILGDSWTSVDSLLNHLASTKKENLFP
jgi:hypothetical protein